MPLCPPLAGLAGAEGVRPDWEAADGLSLAPLLRSSVLHYPPLLRSSSRWPCLPHPASSRISLWGPNEPAGVGGTAG